MISQKNMAGGKSFFLNEGDDLAKVPRSHRDIITPEIRQAFEDPAKYFRGLGKRCEFPAMDKWLRALVKSGKWMLVLEEGFMMERFTLGSFYWLADKVISAYISPAVSALASHPIPAFAHYFSLVDVVHWDNFGCAGGLLGINQHPLLANYGMPSRNKLFPPNRSRVWGNSLCGDMLIYSDAGKAGFLSHENGKAYELGSVEQGIEFVFGELLAGRTPEFDYSRK